MGSRRAHRWVTEKFLQQGLHIAAVVHDDFKAVVTLRNLCFPPVLRHSTHVRRLPRQALAERTDCFPD